MPDTDIGLNDGSADILKILMLTGAVVGIISVFQLWFSNDLGSIVSFEYSGYDLFTKRFGYPDSGYFLYMPLLVLIFSASAIVTSLLTFIGHERKGSVICIALGVCIIVATLLYIFYPETEIRLSTPAVDWITTLRLRDNLGAGAYSAIIAGAFIVVGGALIRIREKTSPKVIEPKEPEEDEQKSNIP